MSFSSARPGFLRRVSNRLALLTAEGATVEDMEFEEVSEPSIDRTSELEQKKDVFAAWQIEAAAVDRSVRILPGVKGLMDSIPEGRYAVATSGAKTYGEPIVRNHPRPGY